MTVVPDKLPCSWCEHEYKCPVAMTEAPDAYFAWMLSVYQLSLAGFTIKNEQLSLDEWRDLGILKALLDAKKDHENLASVSAEMLSVLVKAQRRG